VVWNLHTQTLPALGLDNERNKMKTMLTYTATTAAVALLSMAYVSPALGGDSRTAAPKEKTFKGSVSAVDVPDKTLSVKGFFFTRNFHMGNDCKVSLEDRAVASLAELRPGQKVDVRYEDDNGVLIAMNIAQYNLAYTGRITAMDPVARTLTLKDDVMIHNLAIAPDCAVVLKGTQAGTWDNLQIGDPVTIIYEKVNDSHLARRIEQKSDTFTGTLEAIDATTRSVRVKATFTEKKFNLSDSCPIVINGKLNGSLSDLRIGQRVSLNYDDKQGVLVANRVSPMTSALVAQPAVPAPAQTAAAASQPPSGD
jgi:cold shock CspA family protein